jgi:four helix bundle protein
MPFDKGILMNYHAWEKSVPFSIKADSLWRMRAYRYALFLSDICWRDVTKLIKDQRTVDLSNQLYNAVGSISAHMADGYSRKSSKNRVQCYEYALGAARQSRDWYYKARLVIGDNVIDHRITLITEIIQRLQILIPEERGQIIQRDQVQSDDKELSFLTNIPFSKE